MPHWSGLYFRLLCDARLYGSAFCISQIEVRHYIGRATARPRELGLEEIVEVLDYAD